MNQSQSLALIGQLRGNNHRFNAFFSECLKKSSATITFITYPAAASSAVRASKFSACPISLAWPVVRIKSSGLPTASGNSMNLVGSPPFEAPGLLLAPNSLRLSSTSMTRIVLSITTCCRAGYWLQAYVQKFPDLIPHACIRREKRLKTEFYLPNDCGNKRHYALLRKIHNTAFKKTTTFLNAPHINSLLGAASVG